MQPLARDGLTDVEVRGLLSSDAPEVSYGVDLLDNDGTLIRELDVSGCRVTGYRTAQIKRAVTITTREQPDWVTSWVAPWQQVGVARFQLGVFRMTTPRELSATDDVEVSGFDAASPLRRPVADSLVIAQGTSITQAIRDVIALAGITGQVMIDPRDDAVVLDQPAVWALSVFEPFSYIRVINDLCEMLSYTSLYADYRGRLRAERYVPPENVPPAWTFDAGDPRTDILLPERTLERDIWEGVNVWRGIRSDMDRTPVLGDGIYQIDRSYGGAQRVSVFPVSAANQDALRRAVEQRMSAETERANRVNVSCGPLPALDHDDVVRVVDPAFGLDAVCRVINWVQDLGEATVDLTLGVADG